jgi:hypothetical protein
MIASVGFGLIGFHVEDRLMKPADASAIPLDMEQARQELEAWRSTHRPGCHIPDSLWKRAAELASRGEQGKDPSRAEAGGHRNTEEKPREAELAGQWEAGWWVISTMQPET